MTDKIYPKISIKTVSLKTYIVIDIETILRKKHTDGIWYKLHVKKVYYHEHAKYSPDAVLSSLQDFNKQVYMALILHKILPDAISEQLHGPPIPAFPKDESQHEETYRLKLIQDGKNGKRSRTAVPAGKDNED